MRRSLAMAVITCALGAGIAQAREFPYTAVVVSDEAYARSGPGRAYYETLRLRKGDKVLVQRHDPGGWFAIAPPTGSFSWVKDSQVRQEADGVGTVVEHNVEVRVGNLKPVTKSFHQVRLPQGEKVKILDEREGPSGGKWYRIAPPTGELRWIAGRDVAAEDAPPETSEAHDEPTAAPAADTPTYEAEPEQNDAAELEQADEPLGRETDTYRPQPSEFDDDPYADAQEARRPFAPRTDDVSRWQETAQRQTESPESYSASKPGATEPGLDPSSQLIAEANRDLIAMIRQEIALWDFSDIRRSYEEARHRATTPHGKARALDRLDHLARYERIKATHDGFHSALAVSRYRDRAVRTAYERKSEVVSQPRPRYDGTGILRRASFQGTGTPPYVLTDAQGNVRYYVVPGTGVDLHTYLDQTVAVYGTQSYRSDLLAQQIAVRKVLPVEPLRRAEITTERRRN